MGLSEQSDDVEDYERQCSTALALRTRGRGALRLKSSHFFGTGARFAGGGTYHTPGPSTKTNARNCSKIACGARDDPRQSQDHRPGRASPRGGAFPNESNRASSHRRAGIILH